MLKVIVKKRKMELNFQIEEEVSEMVHDPVEAHHLQETQVEAPAKRRGRPA